MAILSDDRRSLPGVDRAEARRMRRRDPLTALNPNHAAFAMEYVACGNATEAAIRAGYGKKNAGRRGFELLEREDVQRAVTELLDARAIRTSVSVDRVVKEMAVLAFAQDGGVSNRDKLKALELLGRHLGLFDDRIRVQVGRDELAALAEKEGLDPAIIEGEYREVLKELEAGVGDDGDD